MSALVTLTWQEVIQGAMAGIQRNASAKLRGLPDRHGFLGAGWDVHIEGALGEIAAAKAAGLYWSPTCDTFRNSADVGKSIEVRTRSRHDYELIVRRDDGDTKAFVLVTGSVPNYEVRGWILGREAKRDEWLRNHGGRPAAFFVPTEMLRPVATLRVVARRETEAA